MNTNSGDWSKTTAQTIAAAAIATAAQTSQEITVSMGRLQAQPKEEGLPSAVMSGRSTSKYGLKSSKSTYPVNSGHWVATRLADKLCSRNCAHSSEI